MSKLSMNDQGSGKDNKKKPNVPLPPSQGPRPGKI